MVWNTEPLELTGLRYLCFMTQLRTFEYIGNHPTVSVLMSGIFKRPPQPKYPFIWDVETVLDFLRKLTGNDLLSDKLLTLSLSMVLSMLSASRVSEIIHLRVDYLTKH